jgi:hypothetical protein
MSEPRTPDGSGAPAAARGSDGLIERAERVLARIEERLGGDSGLGAERRRSRRAPGRIGCEAAVSRP